MLYSHYCTRAPQTRYSDYDHVKKQMYKLHAPHKGLGYISSVEFRETRDGEGQPDWEMLYTPGRRAKAEFRTFAEPKKSFTVKPKKELSTAPIKGSEAQPAERDPLLEQLRELGVAEAKAAELVRTRREAVEEQIAALPYREPGQGRKNGAGWLIAAIEGNYTLPVAYLEDRDRKQQAAKAGEQMSAVEVCHLCDANGWRRISTPEHPSGAMKRCTHDPKAEAKYNDA
jgi:hypothetical protein